MDARSRTATLNNSHNDEDSSTPPTVLAHVLGRFIAERGWGERLRDSQVHQRWVDIVGADLATRVEPVRLRGGVLVVRTESGAWASQLRYLSPWLLERAQHVLGPDRVERIHIISGSHNDPSRSSGET